MGEGAGRLRLQPLTRARVASLGEAGQAWQSALPQVLAELSAAWDLSLGRALPGGSHSYVAQARTRTGDEAVVKVALTGDGFAEQAATLARAEGRGYARLLAVDLDRHALLLESLGPPLDHAGLAPEDQLVRLADTLALAWQPPPPGAVRLPKAEELRDLIATAWTQLDRPCSERVIAQALGYADWLRTPAPGDLVVVHGDPHPGNALAVRRPRPGAETGYCFVDPDGFVADPAYDLGVALRDWSSRLTGPDARPTAERYARLLAEHSGLDLERIWRWGFVERVSTGLYVMSFGARSVGQPFLDSAERLLD